MARNGTVQSQNPWGVKADDSKGDGDFEKPPEGNQTSVLVALIDLGTHDREYKSKHRDEHSILLVWELVDETKQDGTPHVMWGQYAFFADMSKKSNLRLLLEAWRGKPYKDGEGTDLDKLLGQPCQLNLGDKDGNIKILSVAPVPKKTQVSRARLPLYHWSFAYDEPPRIPEWVPFVFGTPAETLIQTSQEWTKTNGGKSSSRSTQKSGATQGRGSTGKNEEEDEQEEDLDNVPF